MAKYDYTINFSKHLSLQSFDAITARTPDTKTIILSIEVATANYCGVYDSTAMKKDFK